MIFRKSGLVFSSDLVINPADIFNPLTCNRSVLQSDTIHKRPGKEGNSLMDALVWKGREMKTKTITKTKPQKNFLLEFAGGDHWDRVPSWCWDREKGLRTARFTQGFNLLSRVRRLGEAPGRGQALMTEEGMEDRGKPRKLWRETGLNCKVKRPAELLKSV